MSIDELRNLDREGTTGYRCAVATLDAIRVNVFFVRLMRGSICIRKSPMLRTETVNWKYSEQTYRDPLIPS